MGKARITYEIIAGILSLCTVGGTTVMCVPSTQAKIADYTAENLSPKYAQTIELTKEQQNKIKNLEFELDENGKILVKAQADLDTANKSIKDRDATIQELNEDLDTANGLILDKDDQITSLQNEKTTLTNEITSLTKKKAEVQEQYEQGLITIAERDATITDLNSQIDSKNTLIEEKDNKIALLQNEKQLLNSQVEELTTQKTQLETEIASLTNTKNSLEEQISQLTTENANLQKQVEDLQERLRLSEETAGVEYLYDCYEGYFFENVRSTKLDSWVYRDINKSYFASILTNNGFGIYKKTRVKVKYSNFTSYAEFNVGYYNMNLSDIQWSIDDESKTVDEIRAFVNESINDYIGIYSYLSISADNGSQVTLKVNIQTTRLLTGIYYKNDGTFIDFDNPENTTTSFSSSDWRIGANTDYESYIVLGGWLTTFEKYDDYILINGDIKFTRNAPTPTAEQVYVTVNGQIDTEQYLNLTFDKGAGTFKITNSSDSSIVQEYSIEFVSFDVVNKRLTFKDASTDNQFVFTDTVFALSEDGNTYVITGANYNNSSTN